MKAHKQKRLLRRLSWEPFMRLFCFHVVVKHALPPKPEKDLTQQGVSIKNGERRFTGTSRTLTSTRHCTLDGLLVPLMARWTIVYYWLDGCAQGLLKDGKSHLGLHYCYSWIQISGGCQAITITINNNNWNCKYVAAETLFGQNAMRTIEIKPVFPE